MQTPPETTNEGKTVLVTGGSGYVATWVIIALLRRGYTVRATVRRPEREARARAAVAREIDAGDRLSFFAADLVNDAGWERAVDGAQFIQHVASPMPIGEYKGTDVIRPAREGTLRVLTAGVKAGVERVVITSSVQAALPTPDRRAQGPTDETVWTDLSAKGIFDYTRAKTLAERDAWDFMGQGHGPMTLTTVLPVFIGGPVLGPDYSGSLELVARLLNGKVSRLPRIGFSVVDVRDLAELHVKAMTAPGAAGQRFVASSDFLWMADMASILRAHLGSRAARVPTRTVPDFVVRLAALFDSDVRQLAPNLGRRRAFSSAKAGRLLGWRSRPAAETIVVCGESLVREGLV